ncbi:MAG TPA: transposase [Acholeplasmataceae bacterium]|nr:transposase [Acholeplasmataceae bacterium]
MEIHVIKQSENSKQACIGCKSNNIVTHGYDTRRIKDLTIAGFNSYLLYKPRRFKCKECSKTFNEDNDIAAKNSIVSY